MSQGPGHVLEAEGDLTAPSALTEEALRQRLLPSLRRPRTPLSRSSSSCASFSYTPDRIRGSQREQDAYIVNNTVADRARLSTTYQASSPYAFVIYLLSGAGYIIFLLWAYTPDAVLRSLGVSWFPNREWALLLPAWICMLVVYIYVAFASYSVLIASPPDALETLSDGYAIIPQQTKDGVHPIIANSGVACEGDALPHVQDLPLGLVNRVLFGDFRHEGVGQRDIF